MNTLPSLIGQAGQMVLNRTRALNSRPFDLDTPVHPPQGRWTLAHYGIMVPDLPEPFSFLDTIVILGTARVPIFGRRELVQTTPEDSGWLLVGTAAGEAPFEPYSAAAGGWSASSDGMHVAFGDEFTLNRSGAHIGAHAAKAGVVADLSLTLTSAVSHFVRLPGIYDHWSVLAEYNGTFTSGGTTIEHQGLCTYEYARAIDLALPLTFFTYQILNVTPDVQVLMVEVLGAFGIPAQRTVYLRDRSGAHQTFERGYRHIVHTQTTPKTAPDGALMSLPGDFSWSVQDATGAELIWIDGRTNDDFRYGLGSGFAGSYTYTGRFHGEPIDGLGYIEWIDRR